jgi:hypothetical protein
MLDYHSSVLTFTYVHTTYSVGRKTGLGWAGLDWTRRDGWGGIWTGIMHETYTLYFGEIYSDGVFQRDGGKKDSSDTS